MQTRIYCFLTGLFFSFAALAQEPVVIDSSKILEAVTVRAFEQNKQLKEVSAAVIAIDRGQLDRFSNTSLVPAFNSNPGVRMEERSPGSYRLNIRGSTLRSHAEAMKKHPGMEMEHDEPFAAHVAPGKSRVLVWQFTKPGNFHFGCLEPGHFEAGMVGSVVVKQ